MNDHLLFIDKYLPKSFDEIKFNQEAAQKLTSCAKAVNIPHMIIKGGEGSGRKTFAQLYIKSKYHLDDLRVKYQKIEIKNASKVIELQMLYSDYHYQIDPSTHGVYDRVIVQGFIKDILQTKPICGIPYHIVIITNADRLTFEAQQSLRRTLEKNINNCRFIFIINQESTLIESLISRCIQIRLSSPNENEITDILENICLSEKITYEKKQIQQIASQSKRNLSKAMNTLQYIYLNYPHMLIGQVMLDIDEVNINDKHIAELVNNIVKTKNLQNITGLRESINHLLVQCVDPLEIMKKIFYLVFEYAEKKKIDDQRKHQLIQVLSKYENSLRLGSKPIYHLEGFVISVINLLNGIFITIENGPFIY